MARALSTGYPGILDLMVAQGGTYRRTFTWTVDTVPVDLTGFTATLTIRSAPSADTAVATVTSGSGLTLGGVAGTVAVLITDTVTAAIHPGTYVWDLFLVSGGGETTPLLTGNFIVSAAVTRV